METQENEKFDLQFTGNRTADFHRMLYDKLVPIQQYVQRGEDARLRVELGRTYLKNEEQRREFNKRGQPSKKTYTYDFSSSDRLFIWADTFILALKFLIKRGDCEGISVDILKLRDAAEEETNAVLRRYDIVGRPREFKDIISRLVNGYEVFGRKNNHVNRGMDHIRYGYNLKDNLKVVFADNV